MTWIEYDYVCNENKGITYHKKLEYNETNLAIARKEAVNGNYTITEDDEVVGVKPMPIEFGGTNAKTAEEACRNVGGINTYTHASNGLTGMGTNGKFKATTTGTISSIKVNGTTCSVKCGEETSMDLVKGCWYTFILEGSVVNFSSGGAGGGLNFKVVGGTSAPASPKENMIWVNTSTAITDWVFSATRPSAKSGRVWVYTGEFSTVEFNALKKNGIQVYPISAKQYANGAWVDVDAMSYQNGKWVSWVTDIYLYNNGDECVDIGGDWICVGKARDSGKTDAYAASVTRNDTDIYLIHNSSNRTCIFYKEESIDLSNHSMLTVSGDFINKSGNDGGVRLCIWSSIGTYATSNIEAECLVNGASSVTELSIPVSDLNGNYFVGFLLSSQGNGSGSSIRMKTCQLLV